MLFIPKGVWSVAFSSAGESLFDPLVNCFLKSKNYEST